MNGQAVPANMNGRAIPANMNSQAVPANMNSQAVPANMNSQAVPAACIIYFQYINVKIVSFSFYFPFSFIQFGSCSSQPLVSFCPFIVCFLLFYKTYL